MVSGDGHYLDDELVIDSIPKDKAEAVKRWEESRAGEGGIIRNLLNDLEAGLGNRFHKAVLEHTRNLDVSAQRVR